MIKVKRYFQYTAIDAKNLSYFREKTDGIIVNGNVYAHSKKAIYDNAISNNITALIDPMFYMLQAKIKHQSSETEKRSGHYKIKPSLLKLLDIYEINYNDSIPEIIPADSPILNKTFLDVFLENNLTVEDLVLKSENIKKDQSEFYDKNINNESILFSDIFKHRGKYNKIFIAPLLIPRSKQANSINSAIISKSNFNSFPIYINKESFENNMYIKLLEDISNTEYEEIFLWIEKDIKKHSSQILDMLMEYNLKNIAVRYANYEDMILIQDKKINVTKWINAFGYGEDRNILPIGGGLPINKVYSTIQHKRLNFEEFYREYISEDNYLKNYCGCRTCKELILTNGEEALFAYAEFGIATRNNRSFSYATSKAKNISTKHFVWNKLKEIEVFSSEVKLPENSSLWKEVI